MEHERLILLEQLSSPLVFKGIHVAHCLVFSLVLSFVYYFAALFRFTVVCHLSYYGFYYPFDIWKLFVMLEAKKTTNKHLYIQQQN